jgi:hypothetical protein
MIEQPKILMLKKIGLWVRHLLQGRTIPNAKRRMGIWVLHTKLT